MRVVHRPVLPSALQMELAGIGQERIVLVGMHGLRYWLRQDAAHGLAPIQYGPLFRVNGN